MTLVITEGFDYGEFDRPYLVYLDLDNEANWGHYYDSLNCVMINAKNYNNEVASQTAPVLNEQ